MATLQSIIASFGAAGTLNSSSNPIDWTQLKNVPANVVNALSSIPNSGVAAGTYTNASITVNANGIITAASSGSSSSITAGAGLSLNGSTLSIANSGVTNAMLASDSASLSKVSGGAMVVNGSNIGIGTSSPASLLDVAGSVRIGNDNGSATSANAGALRYTGSAVQFSSGSVWGDLLNANSSLSAAKLTGSIPDSSLSSNVALLNANQTYTGNPTFTGQAIFTTFLRIPSVTSVNQTLMGPGNIWYRNTSTNELGGYRNGSQYSQYNTTPLGSP